MRSSINATLHAWDECVASLAVRPKLDTSHPWGSVTIEDYARVRVLTVIVHDRTAAVALRDAFIALTDAFGPDDDEDEDEDEDGLCVCGHPWVLHDHDPFTTHPCMAAHAGDGVKVRMHHCPCPTFARSAAAAAADEAVV